MQRRDGLAKPKLVVKLPRHRWRLPSPRTTGRILLPITMDLPGIAEFARDFATMVRVKGPDPKGLKFRNHAFHHHNSGTTTLSASGMLLPDELSGACLSQYGENSSKLMPGSAVVVSVASIVDPFLAMRTEEANLQVHPELIPHAQIDVLIEQQRGGTKQSMEGVENRERKWSPAQILRLVDVPASSSAVKLLIEASLEHNWEVGWSLGAHMDHSKAAVNAIQSQEKGGFLPSSKSRVPFHESAKPSVMGKKITRIVFLLVHDFRKDLPKIRLSSSCKRGDFLAAMGSPFGILSPAHFFNSVSAGSIANCYPPTSSDRSLLMADIRCLPGMEGAPVFDEGSNLIGLLTKPLRQNGGAEIQLVISWKAIEAACRDSSQLLSQYQGKEAHANTTALHTFNGTMSTPSVKKQLTQCSASSLVEQAMASVCLVSVGTGVWASGVLLNSEGLILTNAHLVEPWRFGGNKVSGLCNGNTEEEPFISSTDPTSARDDMAGDCYMTKVLQPSNTSLDHSIEGHRSHPVFKSSRQISVRLDHVDPWVWYNARVVYVCQGALDVSLLKLETFPSRLSPINVDLICPPQGSKAFVIGHGLFGPRCGLHPSISSGVIAQVVKSKRVQTSSIPLMDSACEELPAMIETTAAVHAGSSGGAVVNSAGRMIGLVTSNAKHGGQTIIPHMNFSIPCSAMEPIFKFAKDMKNTSLLDKLDRPNKELSSVWSMMPPLPSEPGPSIPAVQDLFKDKQGKGSRFAKFIAESEQLFKKPNQAKTTKTLPRDTVPSKL